MFCKWPNVWQNNYNVSSVLQNILLFTIGVLVKILRPVKCDRCIFLRQKAEAELAYELQGAKEKQKIRSEEIEIEVVERRKQIDVEEKEILRKEKELIATVKRPAEAAAYKMGQLAEGQRSVVV